MLSQAELAGPSLGPIEIENEGTVVANADPNTMPNTKGQWIAINYVNFFTLSGGGIFDGQGGLQAWASNDCNVNTNCPKLPIVRILHPVFSFTSLCRGMFIVSWIIYYIIVQHFILGRVKKI